jgi:hypothetical protein
MIKKIRKLNARKQMKFVRRPSTPRTDWRDLGEGFGWRAFVTERNPEPEGVECPQPEKLDLWAETLWV